MSNIKIIDNIRVYNDAEGSYSVPFNEISRVKTACIRTVAEALAMGGILSPEQREALIVRAVETNRIPAMTKKDREKLMGDIRDEVFGLGPLERVVKDDEISEVMVNGPKQIMVEHKGKIYETDVKFEDDAHVRKIIDRIVGQTNRSINEANPMVDCRLKDGSRVNAIIPPVSLKGPCLTIRKFSPMPYTIDDFLKFGTLNKAMAEFIGAAVRSRMNILVSGGTGSGKTTLLNVLSNFIPATERIVTIEDAAELKLCQPHVVPLEARPANIEGSGEITIRDLVRNSLRMRPDRIIVGEVRAGESIDMLQAMNTGHEGSLTTIHANSPRDALSRVETTTLMSGMDLPSNAIRQQISSAFDLIIHTQRLRDGSRKIVSIAEVGTMNGSVISTQEIFKYVYEINYGNVTDNTVRGHFEATGVVPLCVNKMKDNGAIIKNEWFMRTFR